MRKSPFLVIGALIAMLILSACGTAVGAASTSGAPKSSGSDCLFQQFNASVYSGPDTGLSLQGNLVLHIDNTGSVTGVLKRANQPDVQAVGQANGRAINLVFGTEQNNLIYGVGTLQNPIQLCKGAVGGPLVGPREKDSGSWQSIQMCTVASVQGINCLQSFSSRGNPDAAMSPRACCK